MNKEEKDAIEFFIHECEKYDGTIEIKGTSVGEETRILNMIVKCLKEFNGLKEIEQSHQEENGKLRVEFEKVYEDNLTLAKELEQYKRLAEMNLKDAEEFQNNMCEHRCILYNEIEELKTELFEEKEKNKGLQKQLNGAFDRGFIHKDKIREFIKEETKEGTYNFKSISAKKLKELLEESE